MYSWELHGFHSLYIIIAIINIYVPHFWQFAQFRNCIAHSVNCNCQIACQFLNCVCDFKIVQRVYTGGRFERTYFDVRVFNPHAPSNWYPHCYRKHEIEMKCQYEQRVREIEHSSFTPFVLSATGGMAKEATVFYKRLASCLAAKWDQSYSATMSWLRCRLTFSLLRSAIQCIRGARSSISHATKSLTPSLDLVILEANFI